MLVGVCTITLRAPWVRSLKEKRMIIKSIVDKVKNKFNVAIAEVDSQDVHETIVLGFACVSNEARHAQSMVDTVIRFIESHCEAEVSDIFQEIL